MLTFKNINKKKKLELHLQNIIIILAVCRYCQLMV